MRRPGLSKTIKELQATVDAVTASLDSMLIAGVRATDVSVDLAAALSKSNAATTRAASRAARAAAAYDAMALSAARAAAGVQSVGAASAAGRFGPSRAAGAAGMGAAGGYAIPMIEGDVVGAAVRAAKGAALIGAGLVADSVFEAGKFQQILLSIKNETGASKSQMTKFSDAAYRIGAQNGMSANEAGEILRTISRLTAGQFSTNRMIQVAPMVAKYASLVHFNRPDIGVEEAAKTGIQTAHLFRAYTPEALKPLLDKTYRLSGLMAEKPDAALRQMSYYEPLFKAAHVSDETSLAMMALLDRAGFRNKVGTNVRALALESFGPLQVTQSAQAGKARLLENMGLLDKRGQFAWNAKDGGVNYFGELGAISKWAATQARDHVPMSKVIAELTGALGKQGATVGALFLDKQMPDILDGITKYLRDKNVGLDAAEKNRNSGFDYQFVAAGKDFQSLMTELGTSALPGLTRGFKDLGDTLHDAQGWLHQHRDLENAISAWTSSNVMDLERFLKVHAGDFKYMGDDAVTAMHAVQGLGTAAVALGGDALSAYGSVHKLADFLLKLNPIKPPDNVNDHLSATTAAKKLYDESRGKKQFIGPGPSLTKLPDGESGASILVTAIGSAITKALGIDVNAKQPSWGGSYTINQTIHVAAGANPKAVAAAAAAGVKAATGGAHQTHASLPNAQTVSQGHGAW